MATAPNPFLLAADNHSSLLPLLRSKPSLASEQDEHGYSLVHAAASYNHLDLLRALVAELDVPVDLRDEDGETALFVSETAEAARVLVEELGADVTIRGHDGMTALDKIESEGDHPAVAAYLREIEARRTGGVPERMQTGSGSAPAGAAGSADTPPALPEGLSITVGTMDEDDVDIIGELDPESRRQMLQTFETDGHDNPEFRARIRDIVEGLLEQQSVTPDRSVRQRTT